MPSPITITATLNDPSGTGLQGSAFIRFRLRNFQGFVPRVAGTAICAETVIDAFPNGSGSVAQALWANSAITPSSTFYTVEFHNQGRITSSGNYIFNANTDLDSASQVNTPPVPAGFSLVLENNGTLNSSQSTLNLENTDGSITITDMGAGTLNLTANSSKVAAGQNVIQRPSWGGSTVFPANGSYLSTINLSGHTAFEQISSGQLLCQPSNWKLTIASSSGSTAITVQIVIIKCTRGTGTVVSSAAVTFGGLSNPTLNGTGALFQSDAINFPLVAGFDYYFAFNITSGPGFFGIVAPGTGQIGNSGGLVIAASNALPIGSTLPSWSGSTSEGSNSLIFDLVSA